MREFLLPLSLCAHLAGVKLSDREVRIVVRAALREDVGSGDDTTLASIPQNAQLTAVMRAREPLPVAGLAYIFLFHR